MDIVCYLVIGAWIFLNTRIKPDIPTLFKIGISYTASCARRRPINRQGKRKNRPLAGRAFDPDPAVMEIDDAFGDCQSDTGPDRAAFGGIFNLVEGFKNFIQVLRFNSDAVVGNLNQQVAPLVFQADGNLAAAGFAEFYGI